MHDEPVIAATILLTGSGGIVGDRRSESPQMLYTQVLLAVDGAYSEPTGCTRDEGYVECEYAEGE